MLAIQQRLTPLSRKGWVLMVCVVGQNQNQGILLVKEERHSCWVTRSRSPTVSLFAVSPYLGLFYPELIFQTRLLSLYAVLIADDWRRQSAVSRNGAAIALSINRFSYTMFLFNFTLKGSQDQLSLPAYVIHLSSRIYGGISGWSSREGAGTVAN